MEPTFRAIADLFAVPDATVEIDEPKSKKVGDTADESDELGRQSLNDGDFQTAIDHFRRAVEQRDPKDIRSRIDLAGAYDYSDQYPQALRQYEKALRAQGDAAEPHVGISDLYKRYGRFRDSIMQLEAAVAKEPANPYYSFKLSETLREAGEPKRALQVAQGTILIKPDEAHYHFVVADILMQLGRYDEALEALRAAIELSPGDDFLYLRTTIAFWRAGRTQEAVKAIRLASELDPNKDVYYGLLRRMLLYLGNAEEAALEESRANKMDRYDLDLLDRFSKEMGL